MPERVAPFSSALCVEPTSRVPGVPVAAKAGCGPSSSARPFAVRFAWRGRSVGGGRDVRVYIRLARYLWSAPNCEARESPRELRWQGADNRQRGQRELQSFSTVPR